MAFHVACPITCRSICFCTLGFPQKLQSDKGRKDFLQEVVKIEEFLRDPWSLRVKEEPTVQVLVPRVEPPPLAPAPVPVVNSALGDGIAVPSGAASVSGVVGGDGYNVDAEELLSGHSKRTALQKKGENDSKAAEDYARRFESGALLDISGEIVEDLVGEAQAVKVMCRICCDGEKEGSERALRMLPCKICNRRYHASCLKVWGQHRDLFHLSSWTCPLCRTCEVCRRSGDPKKFMFCKRCDGAYHCYCQQPPHKNVSTGPYLCPKHTRCHSCGSSVPGNGLSTRWFLGYTCCDACGRLFNKGNYCPVCLKVYRDSESTPMVCCDDCQRWVHCQCDGISDEKYYQFQADGNLHYTCPACRGECYQIEGHDDAIRELWKRRDKADRNQIAILRAAAGLPSEEKAFSVSIYSDDDEHSPAVPKHEHGRSLKFSVKGSAHKSAKNKDHGKLSNKKYGKKKGYQVSLVGDIKSDRSEGQEMMLSPAATTHGNAGEKCSVNQAGIVKHDFVEEDVLNREDRSHRVVQIKNNKSPGPDLGDGSGKHTGKSDSVKGKKLVIHLGSRNRNTTNSPRSEASSGNKEQELSASNGERLSSANQSKGTKYSGREGASIKLGKVNSEVSELNPQTGRRNFIVGSMAIGKTRVLPGGKEGIAAASDPLTPVTSLSNEEVPLRRHSKGILDIGSRVQENNKSTTSGYDPLPNDPKPLLKLKFKNPYLDSRNTFVPQTEEEKTTIKGQRSKRKRPSSFEQNNVREDEDMAQIGKDNSVNEVMDANWILKKLGKEAIGKKVEVHQPSDSSWHKGVVTDAIEGTSTLAVRLDDGRNRMLELGKQAVRFVPQKRSRT